MAMNPRPYYGEVEIDGVKRPLLRWNAYKEGGRDECAEIEYEGAGGETHVLRLRLECAKGPSDLPVNDRSDEDDPEIRPADATSFHPAKSLSCDEQFILGALARAWDRWCALPSKHPDDIPEFRHHLNILQMLVAYRVARRIEPAIFGETQED